MIKKVPDLNAWVFNVENYLELINKHNTPSSYYILRLPLFSTSLTINNVYINDLRDHIDEICCLIDCNEKIDNDSFSTIDFTLEKIEAINLIWNNFYD